MILAMVTLACMLIACMLMLMLACISVVGADPANMLMAFRTLKAAAERSSQAGAGRMGCGGFLGSHG